MPRKHPQPFWRDARQCYYVQLGTKQVRLDPDRDEAFRLYHELMSRRPEEKPPPSDPAGLLAVEVLDAFLEWAQQQKAARTYAWYRENIQRFINGIPADLRVSELKPYHVTRAMAPYAHWANNTKNDFISAVQRAFNWALDEELIDRSPLARIKKPGREAREMAVSPAEYRLIVEAVKEPRFRDLIELAWETGCRPQELPKIEAGHVDLDARRIVLPPSKAKGKKRYRVVYLTDHAHAIVARLCQERPNGPILLNAEGNPWNKDSINCAFCRLQKKIGKKYHLGAFRKGFTTEALKNGVDTVTLAHLLGHADASMVSRVYAKVQQDPEFMAEAANRAKGVKAAAGV